MTAHSKLTSQGQISVPAEIRRKLGIGPGSILEWEAQDGQAVVRKAGRSTFADVHIALFPESPAKRSPANTKDAIRKYIRTRHARD